jgi:CheY-like chemotaxis protein
VEDNPDCRESLQLLLVLLGYEVEVAANGAEGIRLALQFLPDIALIDIGLPDVDGYEVARRIRGARGRRTVLVAHSAYDQTEVRYQMAEAGFDGQLVKPVGVEDLSDWLDQAVHEEIGCSPEPV